MKISTKNAIFIALGVVIIFGSSVHFAHALGVLDVFKNPMELFNALVAAIFNLLMSITGWLLAIAGFLLNVSIKLTLNIKEFVDSTPGIYTTWKAIRDVSGIFLIFFLLYAAIQMILGLESPGWGKLIKNIVMAGILINFSFFFAGLGIDLSNIVSMQLYNAIAPVNSATAANLSSGVSNLTARAGIDGGISDIFMNALNVQDLYNASKGQQAASVGNSVFDLGKIALVGTIGIIIQLTAAFSFAAAALAFIARFVILMFLLAFSPIWFLSMFPEIDEYVGQWKSTYKAMLVFMPVYLLLMYLAMSVISTTSLFNPTSIVPGAVGQAWYNQFITIGINATLIIFLLNIPLVAAAAVAGKTPGVGSILGGAAKKFSSGKIAGWGGGWVGTRTVGKWSAGLDKAIGNTRLGNSLLARDIRGATTGALANSKMGYSRSNEERVKAQKEVDKKSKEINREIDLKAAIKRQRNGEAHPVDPSDPSKVLSPHTIIGRMNEKEKVALMDKNNDNPEVLREIAKSMKGSDFDAAKKSDDIKDEDKATILGSRKKALQHAVDEGQDDLIKHMVSEMDGKDLLKMHDPSSPTGSLLTKREVIKHLKPSQLKTMAEEGLDAAAKGVIASDIRAATTPPHKARGWINKAENATEWP